jgi:NAD(P)-dependent dehydrogenase (short-subunit alcohol dehydrogenase family)
MAGERVNRKLAAILAADVVGYSRLMAADEAGTLAAVFLASEKASFITGHALTVDGGKTAG